MGITPHTRLSEEVCEQLVLEAAKSSYQKAKVDTLFCYSNETGEEVAEEEETFRELEIYLEKPPAGGFFYGFCKNSTVGSNIPKSGACFGRNEFSNIIFKHAPVLSVTCT